MEKLDLAADDEIEAVENIGRSKNHRMRTIEEIITEAKLINKYHELKKLETSDPAKFTSLASGEKLSLLISRRNKIINKKNEEQMFKDITDINDFVGADEERDRENLIVEKLENIRDQILAVKIFLKKIESF